MNPQFKYEIRQFYSDQLSYLDRQLLRLLDFLEREGFMERAIVAFTSDHGEEFWEHGGFEHGHALHPEVVKIPLIIVRPGGPRGVVKNDPVSLVDVMPTLLGAAGLEIPRRLDGTDLAQAVDPDRIRFMQGSLYYQAWTGLIQNRWVFLRSSETTELYDREVDPEQKSNIAGEHPDLLETFQTYLEEVDRAAESTPGVIDTNSLKSLGYIH